MTELLTEGVPPLTTPLDPARYDRFRTGFHAVTGFGQRLLAARLVAVDALPAPGGTVGVEQLRDRFGVLPQYDRLCHALLDILDRAGYLRRAGDRFEVTDRIPEVTGLAADGVAAAEADRLREAYPEVAGYLPLLTTCQARLVEVLDGRVPANEVLFPGGSADLVSAVYRDNVQLDFFNQLCAERVQSHVRQFLQRYPRGYAEVLEVGAGTGGTTGPVLAALGEWADRLRYLYTDVGPVFLRLARRQFGAGRPYLDFARYNVEGSPDDQGFEPHSVDVVLASNVLHATERMASTLVNCHRLLKPGGILVVNEMTRRLDYNTLTFGLAEGWWRYADDEARIPYSPLLDGPGWRAALEQAGFTGVELHGVPVVDPVEQVQSLVVATATGRH
ncbi:class I SAM-dependent methyltransferase [Micromonospora echinofusca]|uniref:Methyltransferase n=1 Tax=Micromonospora echinofusca TaxID=47858 RepID=A0ABS3VNM8_MICEH|nr:class I SAM-dependent methyltransferase [Micromonospora echinofusca]MBO4206129.1 methyltransferase [Micromonospora echinofusca]